MHKAFLLQISIHVLHVEDDQHHHQNRQSQRHFNPRPPCGGRPFGLQHFMRLDYFNPRPPCGGRQPFADYYAVYDGFQSTSSMWRTTVTVSSAAGASAISIHVLHVEDDPIVVTMPPNGENFNPRPPCGGRLEHLQPNFTIVNFNPRPPCGGRPRRHPQNRSSGKFQSTSSVWRTTTTGPLYLLNLAHFNPRPPCGGRPHKHPQSRSFAKFQSTSSVWRTTVLTFYKRVNLEISIHVLRVEDDGSTVAVRGVSLEISIHVLRVEDDIIRTPCIMGMAYFNPRPPCGGRRMDITLLCGCSDFNPRPPCGGRPGYPTPSVIVP